MRNNSDVIGSILNPKAQQKSKARPRNHHRDYLDSLREQQNENRRFKERERYMQSKDKFKMSKFRNVKSKLRTELNQQERTFQQKKTQYDKTQRIPGKESVSNLLGAQDDPIVVNVIPEDATKQKSAFLRKGTNRLRQRDRQEQLAIQNKENALMEELEREKRGQRRIKQTVLEDKKPAVPRRAEQLAVSRRDQSKNFLKENYNTVTTTKGTKPPRQPLINRNKPKHNNFGRVPAYLKKRQQQWARSEEEERQRASKRKDCPPGMELMENDERLATLQVLKENKKKINEQLVRMPIIIDTLGLKKRKAELEGKLAEVESAIKLFSRDRVFITK